MKEKLKQFGFEVGIKLIPHGAGNRRYYTVYRHGLLIPDVSFISTKDAYLYCCRVIVLEIK